MVEINKNWIGSLRGIAILLVFLSHLDSFGDHTFQFIIGRIGVVIFFLFSGYLAYESRTKRNRKQYLFNRFIRMYPIYWSILLLSVVVRITFSGEMFSLPRILANMTLFHQFVGFDSILGASWMMPIQVSFFLLIGIFGISLFSDMHQIFGRQIDMKMVTIIALMMLSIIVGYVRYRTGIPFPTAYFLLMAVAFLGLNFRKIMLGGGYQKYELRNGIIRILVFEFGLFIAAWLSYGNEVSSYIIAYNVGLVLFLLFYSKRWELKPYVFLSYLGFPFFLCPEIPMAVVESFVDFSISFPMMVAGWVVKFVLSLALALLITKFIEKPLLVWGKEIEKKL